VWLSLFDTSAKGKGKPSLEMVRSCDRQGESYLGALRTSAKTCSNSTPNSTMAGGMTEQVWHILNTVFKIRNFKMWHYSIQNVFCFHGVRLRLIRLSRAWLPNSPIGIMFTNTKRYNHQIDMFMNKVELVSLVCYFAIALNCIQCRYDVIEKTQQYWF